MGSEDSYTKYMKGVVSQSVCEPMSPREGSSNIDIKDSDFHRNSKSNRNTINMDPEDVELTLSFD